MVHEDYKEMIPARALSALDAADSLLDAGASAGANAFDMTLGGGIADLTPLPRSIISEQPQRTVFRYRRAGAGTTNRVPVLLVPPLAARSPHLPGRLRRDLVQ